jgi:glycosyltransferase involved in cell wall biosynthesis
VQTHVVAVRDFLVKHQVRCAVINVTRFRRPDTEDVYYPRNAAHLAWLLLYLRYDVIHLHIGGNLTARLLVLGLVCCLLPWTKTVLTFHSGGYPSSEPGQSARPLSFRGFVLRRFDRLIGVNPELVEFFHRLGCSPGRIRLISPHALPANAPTATDAATTIGEALPEPLRAFFESHTPVLVTVGLLEPEYDLQLQIEVMAAIRDTHPRAGLVVIGSGSLEAELSALVRAQRDGDHILLCGDIPHPTTLRAIAQGDLFLRTTWYDGDAISVHEALHLGTPVVATDNRMRPDAVRLISARDQSALRQAIEEELAAPRARHQPSGDASEKNLHAVLDLYRELVGTARQAEVRMPHQQIPS